MDPEELASPDTLAGRAPQNRRKRTREAMDLEVPVLARNIPGNAAVVKHEVTGLLFSDPQEFVQLAKRLVSDPALEREIVANGREYVRARHSWQAERCTYQNLIRTLEGSIQD